MKILAILAFTVLVACQSRHTIEASGTATVRHVIDIEFGACDQLPTDAKIACVETFLDILKQATAQAAKQ